MRTPWNPLKRWVFDLDEHFGTSLLWRFFLTLPFFIPYDWHFQAVPFRIEDVEWDILEVAKRQGFNLADPHQWPSRIELLGHILLIFACAWILWCLLGRVMRWAGRRWGASFISVAILVAGFALALFLMNNVAPPFLLPSWADSKHFVVWGGYVRASLLLLEPLQTRIVLFFVMVGFMELILLTLNAQQKLHEAVDGALRSKLAPHFLFNALNTLHAQIEKDPRGAQSTTERLARLFRQVLEVTEHPTTTLRQELSFVEDYLGLERARLGDRLSVCVDVPEELLECELPVLALQVLVENAIKHGVALRESGGEVRIQATLVGRRLTVSVQDPGDGTSFVRGTGKTLENLKQRLASPRDLEMQMLDGHHRVSFTWLQG